MKFKFSHIADCHVGAWRDFRMKDLSIQAFENAISESIKNNVDFVLISGDLFNTAIPDIDSIKAVVSCLRLLKEKNIDCFIIAGSHDFSPNGKTFLDVLEEAGLVINAYRPLMKDNKLRLKFLTHKKTGVKISGILGKKGELDSFDYELLDYSSIEKEEGFKIFMFHTSIDELKPKSLELMESYSVSVLPVGFDYYAGGHIHVIDRFSSEKHKNVIYPGPLFPNSFTEFEKLKKGGFYIVEYDNKINLKRIDIEIKKTELIEINAESMSSEEVYSELNKRIKAVDFEDKLVLLRLYGTITGNISDIDFNSVISEIYNKGAYFVMRNTSKLTKEEHELNDSDISDSNEIENILIKQNINKVKNFFKDEFNTIIDLMKSASTEKVEGERVYDYEARILSEIDKVINENDK